MKLYTVLTKPKTIGGLSYKVLPIYSVAVFIIFSIIPITNLFYKLLITASLAMILYMVLRTVIYATKDDIFFDIIMNNIKNRNPKKVGF